MTATDAHADTDLRARVAIAVHTSSRTVADLLEGYSGRTGLAKRIRSALAAKGVDLGSIPTRSPAEVAAWKARRYPKCKRCAEREVEDASIANLRALNVSLDAQLAEAERQNASLRIDYATQAKRVAELEAQLDGKAETPPPIPLRVTG